jgi:hypothetical protein
MIINVDNDEKDDVVGYYDNYNRGEEEDLDETDYDNNGEGNEEHNDDHY